MKKILLSPLLLFLCLNMLFAQSPPMKWGKIDHQDLEMSVYPEDSGAVAVVLADFGEVRFTYFDHSGISLQLDRHVRIKILKKAGLDYANIEVPLYRKGEELAGRVKAVTYNLNGGKLEEVKMDKDQVFKEELNDNYDVMKFTLPAVKEGSVIEYKYSVQSEYIYTLVGWEFQRDIPTRWSELRAEIPEFFHYKMLMSGYLAPTISENSRKLDRNRIYVNKFQWAMEKVPALLEEPFVTTMDDFKAKIEFELQTIKFPGRMIEHVSHSWEKLAEDLNKDENFGKQIGKGRHLTELVEEITAEAKSDREKALLITKYVREHFKYDGRKRIFFSQRTKKILEEKKGNSADLNLLMVSMMQEAGLNANPVVLSTREHGRLNKVTPLLQDLNYVIAHVKLEDGSLLLDGTNPALPLDMLPFYCLNQDGRIISPDFTSFVKLGNNERHKELASGKFKLMENGTLVGDLTYKEGGYIGSNTRETIRKEGEEKYLESLRGKHADWLIKGYENRNLADVSQELEEVFNLEISALATMAGERIYLQPLVVGGEQENPFKLEKREYPVDFGCPIEEMYQYQIELPEGYEVEALPEPAVFALPEKAGIFRYSIAKTENQLMVMSILKIEKPMFVGAEYQSLKQFYNLVIAKQAEQVVLKKLN